MVSSNWVEKERIMEYNVSAIPSTAPQGYDRADITRSAADIADDIRSTFAAAEGWGGKVIASYSITCAPGYEGEIHKPKGDPSECLFLVMELPDGYEERDAAEVRARQAAGAESPIA
jgi:hypothetical protein